MSGGIITGSSVLKVILVCNETGDITVDFLAQFENLRTDFGQVCRHLGLALTQLPHINQSNKQNSKRSLNPKKAFSCARWSYHNRVIPSFTNYQDY